MATKIKCVVMRGGTSRGLFFHRDDLPQDRESWRQLFCKAMGTPDPKQVDGLGGGTSSSSKIAIINKSNRPGIDVDYTFVQVGVDQEIIDFTGNCGNLSSAVGPFAVDEGLVEAVEPFTEVSIFNTNTGKRIKSKIMVAKNSFNPAGDFKIPGLVQRGSEIVMEYFEPEGALTGRLFPTGKKMEKITIGQKEYSVTIIDCTNPFVLVDAGELNLTGTEPPSVIDSSPILSELNKIREYAGKKIGISGAAFPKISVLSASNEFDLNSRTISLGKTHKTIPLTGAFAIASAAVIPGTLASTMLKTGSLNCAGRVRIGYPGGVINVGVDTSQEGGHQKIVKVTAGRTARRIMEGYIYV